MSIVLEHLTKRYEGHPVVNNTSLEIADGEFFVLLGPSGSGKSTVLRMIAGLTGIDHGRVLLNGRDVTHLPPQQRNVGFVFQQYALFRHMSVADNIEFALRIRKVAAAERRRKRDELLDLVGLAGLGNRMPHQLSGGQQQRVALARALAHQPAVLLLDEPFGALDAKIRTELRRTLRLIQRELGTTTIFVTHDQEEAFELADRLGVMNVGRLLEVGPPTELYQRPQTEFVATFLGTANLLLGECTPQGVCVGPLHFPLETEARQNGATQRVQVLFRPEDVTLTLADAPAIGATLGQAEIEQITFVGSFERLRLRLPPLPRVRPIAPAPPFGSDTILVDAARTQDQARSQPLQPGQQVWVGVRRIHALTHPGLNILIVADEAMDSSAALSVGGQLARLAHARTTLLGYGKHTATLQQQLQTAREQLGSGLPALDTLATVEPPAVAVARETERNPYDLVVLGVSAQQDIELSEQMLQVGEHHLLLVPRAQPTPTHLLICVASGEPGKEDVLFAGRLARHVGADATLLSVVPNDDSHDQARERAERFLAAGARTLATLGVSARTVIRAGQVRDEIIAEMRDGGHDLLVLGAPLSSRDRRGAFAGVVAQLLGQATEHPVLIVRSRYAAGTARVSYSRATMLEEAIR
ncbi:MAG TPA: ATP-binding cassette domain-containing protein [Herpetosiphonaceae bacterium]